MSFSIKLIQDEKDFFALKNTWNALLEKSSANNIFLTWEWISTWWKYFGKEGKLYTLTAHNEKDELVGIAPLHIRIRKIKKRFFPLRSLTFIGSNEAAPDHLDFITAHEHETQIKESFIGFIQNIKSQWDLLDFDGIRENSGLTERLQSSLPARRYFLKTTESTTIALPPTWDEMQQALGKNLRYNIRRYDRKMERKIPAWWLINKFKLKAKLAKQSTCWSTLPPKYAKTTTKRTPLPTKKCATSTKS